MYSSMEHAARSADAEFIAVFDRTAEFKPGDPEYAGYRNFNLRAISRGEAIVERVASIRPVAGSRALDIGAGSAGTSIALANAGATVVAVEPDPVRHQWAAARLRGHQADVELAACLAEQLPYPDGSFDVVILDSVLEHVADGRRVVEEIGRVLAQGGVVYLVWPNKLSLMNIVRDPHYLMLGVVLMPHRLGKFYVEQVRRNPRGYWVTTIPTRQWAIRQFARAGVELRPVLFEGFEKLERPDTIRHPAARRAALAAKKLGAARLLRRVALVQHPSWLFLGVKG